MSTYLVNMSREELWEIFPGGGIIGELGVAVGDHALCIHEILSPAKLVLIDRWAHCHSGDYRYDGTNVEDAIFEQWYNYVKEMFASEIERGRVEVRRQSSSVACREFQDDFFDLFYVDGDHTYQGCLESLLDWQYKVKGFIAGHDFFNNQDAMQGRFGVVAAVEEFCRRTNWKVVCLTLESTPSYVLAREGSQEMAWFKSELAFSNCLKIEVQNLFPYQMMTTVDEGGTGRSWPRIG